MVNEIALAVSIIGVIIIPLLVLMFRYAVRWKGIEDRLDNVVSSLTDIVKGEDKMHSEMLTQMREDRKATDRRLRWLEENLWRVGHQRGNPSS